MSIAEKSSRRNPFWLAINEATGISLVLPDVTGLSPLDAALAYADSGWFVLPTDPADIKNPGSVVKGRWHEQSSRDPEQIRRWWVTNPEYGIALHCGRSGAIVFDLDVSDLSAVRVFGRPDIADALTNAGAIQGTRLEGERGHYMFAMPDESSFGNGAGAFMMWGEVRGKNGVIIAAPTPHPDAETKGGQYRQIKAGLLTELPDVLRECLADAGDSADPLTDAELEAFLDTHTGDGCGREGCRHVASGPATQFREQTANGASRHDTLTKVAPWAFAEAVAGCYPAREAFGTLHRAFKEAFSDDEPGRLAGLGDEFLRIVRWAAALADPTRAHRNDDLATDDELEEFWTTRSVLRDLRQFARARRVGPWAMLGQVLARALTVVPPNVVLPPVIGGAGSLNLFVALVGESGDGKGASARAAADWLTTNPNVYTATLGSGEGMGKVFAYKQKVAGVWQQVGLRHAVLFDAPEVDNLAALGGRSGATLMPQLRSAYSGETLGFTYSDPAKALQLCAHRYRLCLTVGVQPRRAGTLFNDQDGGTPQRFIWLPVLDPEMPDIRPAEPSLLELKDWDELAHPVRDRAFTLDDGVFRAALLDVEVSSADLTELPIPAVAVAAIEGHHVARHRGHNVSPLDGHKLQTRVNVAVGLMWLDGRTDGVTEQDWELAGLVMAVSDRTRHAVQSKLQEKHSEANRAKGRADAEREDVKADALQERKIHRLSEGIRRKLRDTNVQRVNALKKQFSGEDKQFIDAALAVLEQVGDVVLEPVEYRGQPGHVVRLKEGR